MKTVIGENSGAQYKLLKEIGRGAQGRVFSIEREKYAVKILGKKSSKNSQLLKKKISYIRTRNIKDLPISMPLEQISGDYLGYIMEMASDMIPLEELMQPTNDENWWIKSGGLRKRLKILMKLSGVLAELHSRGLVYGDLSPKNIFVSKNPDYAEVYLIDVDNISHQSKIGNAVYTPGYGAPEIIRGVSGADTYTDAFSFSVIAYQLLTLNHPFIGDYVNNGDPELEEEAYAGNLPWINNTLDKMNASSVGFSYTTTVPLPMRTEFKNTFEDNLHDKLNRTSMLKWKEILSKSYDLLVHCENCKDYFNYDRFKKLSCPFCSEKKEYIGLVSIAPFVYKIIKETEEKYSVELKDEPIVSTDIKRFVVEPNQKIIIKEDDLYMNDSEVGLLEIVIEDEKFAIRGIGWEEVSLCDERTLKIKKNVDIKKGIFIKHGELFLFNAGEKGSYQRVIRIRRVS